MRIYIDNKPLDVYDETKNIVDIAEEYRISIPAPCYRNGTGGCCKGCAIMVDGELAYACGTKPRDGMRITLNTPELKALRAKNLKAYQQSLKDSSNDSGCGCDCNCSGGGCCN